MLSSPVFSHSRVPMLLAVLGAFFILPFTVASAAEDQHSAVWIAKKKVKKNEAKVAKKKIRKKKSGRVKRGVRAKAVYCVNLASNRTLVARNPDRQLPVASLTKLITALVTLDHMPLKNRVRVPAGIKKVPKAVVGLKPRDLVSVNALLHGLLMGSGNDCAEALACAFPGGRDKFVAAMNTKARAMGARRTLFHTPSGLDRKMVVKRNGKRRVKVKSNVSTAREIARIARRAFANPTIRRICLKKNYVMASAKSRRGYRVRNTNKLLRDRLPIRGGKTGYTSRAGHCLATKFTPGRNIFLIVVLGSPDHFRDTRLVYRKALKKARSLKTKPPSRRTRHRNTHPTRFAG